MSKRRDQAVELRDAAIAVLRKNGKQAGDSIVFEQHKQHEFNPRLSLRLSKHPFDAHNMLSVWTNFNKDKHAEALNIEWRGNAVVIVSFRRGQWENELLAMGRAIPCTKSQSLPTCRLFAAPASARPVDARCRSALRH
jgi:hypothetical protein